MSFLKGRAPSSWAQWTAHKMPSMAAGFLRGRWFLSLCFLAAAGCVFDAMVSAPLLGPGSNWNDIRVARAYAAVSGFDLYASPDSGVLPGLIYGPLGLFLYFPVVLFDSPAPTIECGLLVSFLLTMGPAALLIGSRKIHPEPDQRTAARLFLIVVFHVFWFVYPGAAWYPHVDAPAIGLTGLCCYFTLRLGRHPDSWGMALAAAATAAAAVWAKQTMVPILIAPAVYLAVIKQRRAAARFLPLMAAFGAAWWVLFGALYGFGDLFFTMFEIPARHSLYPGAILHEYGRLGDVLDIAVLAVIALFLLRLSSPDTRCKASLRQPLLLLALAAGMLPTAILGRIKAAGFSNNFLAPDWFLAVGVCMLILRLATAEGVGATIKRAAQSGILLLLVLQVARGAGYAATRVYSRLVGPPPISRSEQAYRFAKAHPGEAYFPEHPLASLMAEGKLYHTGHGLLNRRQAGLPVSDEQIREHLPAALRYVAAPSENHILGDYYMKRLSKSWDQIELPELPGWSVYVPQ